MIRRRAGQEQVDLTGQLLGLLGRFAQGNIRYLFTNNEFEFAESGEDQPPGIAVSALIGLSAYDQRRNAGTTRNGIIPITTLTSENAISGL